MGAAVGRPYQKHVRDILALENTSVGVVGLQLSCVHGGNTIAATVLGIGAGDADIQCVQPVAECACEHVGWPKTCSRYEVGCIEQCPWITGGGGVKYNFGDPVVPAGDLRLGAT